MIKLRAAELSDWARLLAWRNDPDTRKWSRGGDKAIGLQDHMKWLRTTLDGTTTKRRIFIAYDHERAEPEIGTGRIEVKSASTWELAIVVDPRCRGEGHAAGIVGNLVAESLGFTVTKLIAVVHQENWASLRAFAAYGFLPVFGKDEPPWIVLERAVVRQA